MANATFGAASYGGYGAAGDALPEKQVSAICSCGNTFMPDSVYCRKCGCARDQAWGLPSAFGGMYGNVGVDMPDWELNLKAPAWNLEAPSWDVRLRRGVNCATLTKAFFAPWLLFILIFAVQSFSIKYDNPFIAHLVSIAGLLVVVLLGCLAFLALRRGASDGGLDPMWLLFIFVTCFLGWFLGHAAGTYNFKHNMAPFYEVSNLNTYSSIDPATARGQQVMDAGRFAFTPDSRLDVKLSMGFRNVDTYCVAPVVSDASGNGSNPNYDFWAVGINCCSGHVADFRCGEFSNPMAKAGLRLMKDDMRSYFRLAVQQAEASFNIEASHPVFLYWMQDPVAEINAFQNDGIAFFVLGIFCYMAFQIFCIVTGIFCIVKFGESY